jgi:hypothetical protein
MNRATGLAIALCLCGLVGCGDDTTTTADASALDASEAIDALATADGPVVDAGPPPIDAPPPVDSGPVVDAGPGGQIIADHTVIDRFDDIPACYLDIVKTMWLNVPGESHSAAYRTGLTLLAAEDSTYAAVATEGGDPEAATSDHLRVSGHVRDTGWWGYGAGEQEWYTWYAYDVADRPAEKDLIMNHITYSWEHALPIAAIGFGWCWDMTWTNAPGGTIDPVYGVHWAGSSEGGPDGNAIWGLDDDDNTLTGNRVNLGTYLAATQAYADYAASHGTTTKVFFTTGPVDGNAGTENGYQRHLKHEALRAYVAADPGRILFDYADILSYDDGASTPSTSTWDGHEFPGITDTNVGDASVGHIGSAGAIRLAKGLWWMLARIAGWDGVSTTCP